MKSREFCYWLQGYLEIDAQAIDMREGMSQEQVECIQKHLSLVFKHEIDPSYSNSNELNQIHNPKPAGGGGHVPSVSGTVLRC